MIWLMSGRVFNLNDVRYFLALVRGRNLSAAARDLGVAQPTVGRRIRQLENALGARLFDRTPAGYELTEAGERILPASQRVFANAAVITHRTEGDERELAGGVRVTTSESLANAWLVDKLEPFTRRYPGIRLEILAGTRILDVTRFDADIALRIGTPGSDELVGRRVGQVGFGLYASRAYLETVGEPIATGTLNHCHVIESCGQLAHVAQAERLREMAPEATVVVRTDSLMTQLRAAAEGRGIAALSHCVAASCPALVRILPSEFNPRLDLWLLTHRELKFTARIRATLDFIKEVLESDSALLLG